MPKYEIINARSNAVIGVFEAKDATDALEAMANKAGYVDYDSACTFIDNKALEVKDLTPLDEIARDLINNGWDEEDALHEAAKVLADRESRI